MGLMWLKDEGAKWIFGHAARGFIRDKDVVAVVEHIENLYGSEGPKWVAGVSVSRNSGAILRSLEDAIEYVESMPRIKAMIEKESRKQEGLSHGDARRT